MILTRLNPMPRVSIIDTELTFDVLEGEILYDSLCERGYTLPHGCLAGSCGACRVEIISGQENLQPIGLVEKNTVESLKEEFRMKFGEDFLKNKEIRLSCRARVNGDVSLRPLK
jgi:ferredoxin